MHEDCIFCKIVSGEVPAHTVYENEHFLGFLTIEPIREGHVLLIPKEHYPYAEDMPDELYAALMLLAKRFKSRIGELFGSPSSGLFISGWDVPHTHVHVFPMFDTGDITSKTKLTPTPTTEEFAATAAKLRACCATA